ncbi:hypothetical protein NI17_008720 [Thermobifida halotolerans]|uniref:DUF5753 domain-containing protein n=1 Tax=Thermobifida halotolerans TaxID=483545 RepID=A0AA97M068_9ACTN|nr:Scr1 family TA system antitoxin-like transcriptional regulator [Thermobifida halotolerans]UOE21204.1 hypothetical protein NI17_008720 [Thermobifida halotolerans]
MTGRARQPPRPSRFDPVRLEAAATHIRTFELGFIPGLLQHERYARTAIRAASGAGLSEEELDHFVSVRKQRQQILTRDENPVDAVVHKALLHQHLDEPDAPPNSAAWWNTPNAPTSPSRSFR